MSNRILGFRMRSGEDVVGEVVKEDNFVYTLKRPVVPMRQPVPPGQRDEGALMLLKWAPYSSQEEFPFGPADYVGAAYEIWDELQKYYLEQTSGIQIAKVGPKIVK